jgi:hypothetical protein
MMFWSRPKMRRLWLVNYSIPNGVGRSFLDTEDKPLTEELIRKMDDWLRYEYRQEKAFVTSAVPLGLVPQKEPKSDS